MIKSKEKTKKLSSKAESVEKSVKDIGSALPETKNKTKKVKKVALHRSVGMYNGYLGADGACIACISEDCKNCPYEKK